MTSSRPNILILVDKFDYHGSYINGPTRSWSWLVSHMDRTRFNVHLCALRSRGKSDEILRKENIEVTYLNAGKYDPFVVSGIIKLILQRKIDVVHMAGYGATTLGRPAAAICRRPAIVHERWVDPDIGRAQCAIERVLSRFTTRAIAISEYAREFLIKKKGVPGEKIVVIPNGVPLDRFCNVDADAGKRKRRELGIPDGVKTVGIVGMFHENKGHRYFIEAASLVVPRKPDTRFLLIGDGELREQLTRQVAESGLGDHVVFTGHQEDMPAVFAMLDIFVLASFSETGGISLLEAMAAGKAIVTTDCGGPSEIIRDGVSGFIVPVRDASAIASRVEHLIDHPEDAERMAGNARKDSERFDIRFTAEGVQNLYAEILGNGGPLRAPGSSHAAGAGGADAPVEHIDKKQRLLKVLKSHPLEWVPVFLTASKTLQCRYLLRCTGKKSIVGGRTRIINFSNVRIGSHCLIQDNVYMRAGMEGRIVIGDYCAINSFAKLFGHGGIEIGDHSQLGPGCLITTTHHDYRDELKAEFRKVTIGKKVWVGGNTTILPGVTIGDDSVIGAGSVVTKDIPPGSIAVGSPAKVIRQKWADTETS